MSDIMAQIGRYEWGTNIVGTSQVNWTGADAQATLANLKNRKADNESHLWQNSNLLLIFTAWSNNAAVKLLSSFHPPILVQDRV